MANLTLRDYQKEAVDSVIKEQIDGITRQLIALPTAAGKTIIMAAITKHYNKKTLILAHRDELIQQAVNKLKLFCKKGSIGICKAKKKELDKQIVVGSVQSCITKKTLDLLIEKNFDILMIDEAHHAPAKSYQKIIDALGFRANKLLIGVTATPERNDKLGLGDTFQKITFSRSISSLISKNYLSPVIGRKILTDIVLKKIDSHMGDYAIGQLSSAINTKQRNEFIVQKFLLYAANRKAVAFCADVKHAQDLANVFNNAGIKAAAVWGAMSSEDRKKVLEDLKKGRIQVATSCGVLTEGFDEPSIEAIVMARPTKSKSLYIQCIGRGLRTWQKKKNCLVLDFSDKGHTLISSMTLEKALPELKTNVEKESNNNIKNEKDKFTTKTDNEIEVCDEEFNILGTPKYIWISLDDDEYSLADDYNNEIIIRPCKEGFVAELYYLCEEIKKIVNDPLSLDSCTKACEEFAQNNLKISYGDANSDWMRESKKSKQTFGQVEFLRKNGINYNTNKAIASLLIRKIIAKKNKQKRIGLNEPITFKQKEFLEQNGIKIDNMKKHAARNMILALKQQKDITKN
jgi:ATP-dependent helicase IRC3